MVDSQPRDVVIIGGGHNGLVCAAYLAAAGLKVTVLERRGVVGGAAVTEEFHPGFRNSVAAYTVSLLNPKVIRDLDLPRHGLRVVERRLANFLPLDETQLSQSRRRQDRTRGGEVLRARCGAAAGLRRAPRYYRRCAARPGARNTAECHRRRMAGGHARTAARRAHGQADRQARPAHAPRIVGFVRQVGGRLSGCLVRERPHQGGVWLRRHRRQLRQSLCGRFRVRAAAPCVRRGQRQEGGLGACHRRHGRDQSGHGQGRSRARRGYSSREPGARGAGRSRPRGGRGYRERRSHTRALCGVELESEAARTGR